MRRIIFITIIFVSGLLSCSDGLNDLLNEKSAYGVISGNADLSALTVDNGTLSPAFEPVVTTYTAYVSGDVETVTVTGTAADSEAAVSGPVTLSGLAVGEAQTAVITVTAQNGAAKDYSVTVTRLQHDNADLIALTVDGGTLAPAFDPAVTSYTASVVYALTSVTVTGTKAESNATVTGPVILSSLAVGEPQVAEITVTAQNGNRKTYTVTVTRAANTDANLGSITLTNGGTMNTELSAGTTAYNATVPGGVSSTTVTGTASDPNAAVSAPVSLSSLTVGIRKTASITVTAQDGVTVKTYTIAVDRAGGYTSANIGTMIYVPAGSFQRDNVSTNISVISSPFRMSKYEITRAQYLAVMGTDPSEPVHSTGNSDPVQWVSWYQAIAFCNKLSIKEGLEPVYSVSGVDFTTLTFASIPVELNDNWDAVTADWSANGYRLPTEMEWMWAAMGATSGHGYSSPVYLTGYSKSFAGSNWVNLIGNYAVFGYSTEEDGRNTVNSTSPVGSKSPNELGIYDMSGNVVEFCWDFWNLTAEYPVTGTVIDYTGPAPGISVSRIKRGGSWKLTSSIATVACRSKISPVSQDYNYGFRVVRR